jgi:hypothetical protein
VLEHLDPHDDATNQGAGAGQDLESEYYERHVNLLARGYVRRRERFLTRVPILASAPVTRKGKTDAHNSAPASAGAVARVVLPLLPIAQRLWDVRHAGAFLRENHSNHS